MANDDSNEFTRSLDNDVRPYSNGMLRHPETMSTIIIYTDGDSDVPTAEDTEIDYTSDFTGHVNAITDEDPAGRTASNIPPNVGGRAVMLDLDGDRTNDFYGIFNNFSLNNVAESSEQIAKIQLNFGSDWNAFFFGEKPRMYMFSGVFLDTQDYPYYQEFMVAYDKYMSGRKAIENKLKTVISYDGRIVDGYILNISTQHTAANQMVKQFQFTVLVKESYWVRNNYSGLYGYGMNKFENARRVRRYINDGRTDSQITDGRGVRVAGFNENIVEQTENPEPSQQVTTRDQAERSAQGS